MIRELYRYGLFRLFLEFVNIFCDLRGIFGEVSDFEQKQWFTGSWQRTWRHTGWAAVNMQTVWQGLIYIAVMFTFGWYTSVGGLSSECHVYHVLTPTYTPPPSPEKPDCRVGQLRPRDLLRHKFYRPRNILCNNFPCTIRPSIGVTFLY
jgi:hypothetical protein